MIKWEGETSPSWHKKEEFIDNDDIFRQIEVWDKKQVPTQVAPLPKSQPKPAPSPPPPKAVQPPAPKLKKPVTPVLRLAPTPAPPIVRALTPAEIQAREVARKREEAKAKDVISSFFYYFS